MLTEKQILTQKNMTDANEPIARIIYEQIFARDGRYCGWNSAVYKAPEQPEGFAFYLSFAVANEIQKTLKK